MRNILNTSPQVGDSIYRSPVDFTSAYLGANTLTLAGMPYVPVDNQFVTTIVTTAAGAVVQYPAASYYHSLLAGVLTVAGANFLATDLSVVVVVNGPVRAYNAIADYNRVGEVDPISGHDDLINLVDTTNLAAAANEYPSANGYDMLGRHHFTLNGTLIEGDAGMNIKVEVYGSNDEEIVGASKVWTKLYGRRVDTDTMVSAIICPTTTVVFAWEFACRFRYVKVVVTPDHAASNTVVVKMNCSAL